MNTLSSIMTPSQIKEWLEILQFFPTVAFFWISTNVPIFVLSPTEQPYKLMNLASFTFSPNFTSGAMLTSSGIALPKSNLLSTCNSKLLDQFVKAWATDLQLHRSPREITLIARTGSFNHLPLRDLPRFPKALSRVLRGHRIQATVLVCNSSVPGHDGRALNAVLQFSDVSGPAMRFDHLKRLRRENEILLLTRCLPLQER